MQRHTLMLIAALGATACPEGLPADSTSGTGATGAGGSGASGATGPTTTSMGQGASGATGPTTTSSSGMTPCVLDQSNLDDCLLQ
jgi:hypothetical protein